METRRIALLSGRGGRTENRAAAHVAADKITNVFPERSLSEPLTELVSVLRGLDSGETTSDTARRWASVDLFGVFLGDGNEPPLTSTSGAFWRSLEAMVQVGVFVPIAVTWIGLATAAWAYRSAENAGTLGGESFLQGWERGFGKLPAGLTFNWFATYTCVLVTLLIAAMAAHLQHRWRADRVEADQRQKLTEALVAADLVLAPYRLPAEERAARELDVAADKVAALVSAFDAATGKMSASAGVVGAAAAKMTAAAGTFGTATGAMTAAADKVTATAGAFETSAGKLGSVAGAVDAAAGKMTATAGAFDTAAGTVATAAGKVAATVDVIDTAAGTINATAGAIKSAADLAAATQQEATNAIATASTAISGAEGAAVAAAASAGVLERASNRLGGEVGQLTTAAGQARDSLVEVADAVGGHVSRVEAAADILGKAQQAINMLPTAVTSLQSEVTAVGTQLAALREVTDLSGQLTNLTEVTTAVGELRASLDLVRTSLEADRLTRRPAPQSPPPQSPPTRLTRIFKAFRKRGTSSGN